MSTFAPSPPILNFVNHISGYINILNPFSSMSRFEYWTGTCLSIARIHFYKILNLNDQKRY